MILIAIIALFIAFLCLRTVSFTKKGKKIAGNTVDTYRNDPVMTDELNAHLIGAVQIETVSHTDPSETDWDRFTEFRDYLRKTYPHVFSSAEEEVIGGYSILLRWKGKDSSLHPIAFLSHMDVVPVEPVSEWTYPPFSGTIADGFIWGRGTLDMKCQMIAVLDACERLMKEGFTPKQDVYLLFGCNEEVGDLPKGIGADRFASLLNERGISPDCVIDEGGAITDGSMIGIDPRICAIGVAEKGYASFDICAVQEGGHSSRPPKQTSLGQVCDAACRLEKNWMRPKMTKPVEMMLEEAAPYMKSFAVRLLVANRDIFRPVLPYIFSRVPALRPFVQTTTALTMASASPQDNVLPQDSHIIMNSRILPCETIDEVKRHVEEVTKDCGVSVEIYKAHQVPRISPTDTESYALLKKLVERHYPGTLTIPYIQLGASDSRNYYLVSDNVYRVMPFYFPSWVTNLGHRADERIPVEALERGVKLFMDFIREYEGERI